MKINSCFMPFQSTVETLSPQCWDQPYKLFKQFISLVTTPREKSFDCRLKRHETTVSYVSYVSPFDLIDHRLLTLLVFFSLCMCNTDTERVQSLWIDQNGTEEVGGELTLDFILCKKKRIWINMLHTMYTCLYHSIDTRK